MKAANRKVIVIVSRDEKVLTFKKPNWKRERSAYTDNSPKDYSLAGILPRVKYIVSNRPFEGKQMVFNNKGIPAGYVMFEYCKFNSLDRKLWFCRFWLIRLFGEVPGAIYVQKLIE